MNLYSSKAMTKSVKTELFFILYYRNDASIIHAKSFTAILKFYMFSDELLKPMQCVICMTLKLNSINKKNEKIVSISCNYKPSILIIHCPVNCHLDALIL